MVKGVRIALCNAARARQWELLTTALNSLKDSNPVIDTLHRAAGEGLYDVCQYLLEKAEAGFFLYTGWHRSVYGYKKNHNSNLSTKTLDTAQRAESVI